MGRLKSIWWLRRSRNGPGKPPSPFQDLRYRHDDFGGCKISATVHNTFSEQKDDLQIRVAGFDGGDIATGGFTYVDTMSSQEQMPLFDVNMFSPSKCPPELDEIGVYPNLGEDKIFNP